MVRAARQDDIPAIIALHERCWRISYAGIADADEKFARPREEWVRMWEEMLPGTRVVTVGDVVAGFVLTGPSRDDDAPPGTAEIIALYVDPDLQGGGHGRALVDSALLELAATGYGRVTLWTFARNPGSRAFYERLGFVSDGVARADHAGEIVRYGLDLR